MQIKCRLVFFLCVPSNEIYLSILMPDNTKNTQRLLSTVKLCKLKNENPIVIYATPALCKKCLALRLEKGSLRDKNQHTTNKLIGTPW